MAELTLPRMDFSSLGDLPALYQKNQADALRRQTLASLGQGGTADAAALLKSGDMSLAQLGISLRNRQEDQARQATQDAESARRFGLTHGLAVRSANRADEDKPIFKEVTDPSTGATSIIAINPKTLTAKPLDTGMAPPIAPQNPFNPSGGKFNEGQGKAASFTDRMLQSEAILNGGVGSDGVQSQGADLTQSGLSAAKSLPVVGRVANYAVSEPRQKFDQAKSDFINAQLRRESGAAVSKDEFAKAEQQYFPVPGDSDDVMKQKAANRRAAVEAMGREGGPAYRPKAIYTGDGRVVPLPKTGELKDGYRYKGGDPADPKSWAKAQ